MARADRMLTAAGLLVWIAVGVTVFSDAWPPDGRPAFVRVVAWAAFGAAFLVCMRKAPDHSGPQLGWVLVQTCAAVVLFWFAPGLAGIELALLVVIAGQLPTFLDPFPGFLWLVGQAVAVVFATYRPVSPVDMVVLHTSFFAFQLFAFGATSLAMSERRSRASLARANAELRALHLMLDHESRQAERLRIARELHDSLGHGLTAMALELEAARHRANSEALPHVSRAQQLSKSLLAEVRDVVSSMRETTSVDVATALRALADSSHRPSVALELPSTLAIDDAAAAHAILRAVQEAITNTRRHADASTVRVTLGARAGSLHLEIRDDGRGAAELRPGLGLQGMRERFEQLGGSFDVRTAPGEGLTIMASVPVGAARD